MIALQPFSERDFDTLIGWINSPEELVQFAGPYFQFPLSTAQLHDYLNDGLRKPFKVILEQSGETVGHCEMNFTSGLHRINRVLVGKPELRGKHIGTQIIRLLAERFFEDPGVQEIDLHTFDWNLAAIRCYENVGFRIDPRFSEVLAVHGQSWTRIRMVLQRRDFQF